MKMAFYRTLREDSLMVRTLNTKWRWLLVMAVLTSMWACSSTGRQAGTLETAGSHQRSYASPEAAAQDLIDTLETGNQEAIQSVLGLEVDQLGSGDPVADANERKDFVAAARSHYRIYDADDITAYMEVGPQDWRLPIPIVDGNDGWRFDTQAGVEIFKDLRIGRNELHTIATLRACVEAQYEYAAQNPTGDKVPQFAQRFRSRKGKKDGLYWSGNAGEPESPLGPLMAQADEEGYFKTRSTEPVPYHGYIYRILTAQGAHVPGGGLSYIVNGRMTRGFGLLAYPAAYGNSGIMTFMVNQRGVVYQKNLGDKTPALSQRITTYDPDGNWTPVTEPVF